MPTKSNVLKSNITKLKNRILEIHSSEYILVDVLDELYGLVDRLNSLDLGAAKNQEIIFAQGFANRFITKQNRNDINEKQITDLSILKNILMATYIIKLTYHNLVEPTYRTESELANLSEQIDDLKTKKYEYEDLIDKAKKLEELEEQIDSAEDFIVEIESLKEKANDIDKSISGYLTTSKATFEEISKLKSQSETLVTEYNANEVLIKEQTDLFKENNKNYEKMVSNLNEFTNETKNKFKLQEDSIQKIIDDANRASMAGSFLKRKDETTKSIRFLDGCTLLFLALIVYFLWNIYQISYTETAFSPILFFSRVPITLPLIWLAWLASRKSAYLTRIKEDYAYKYSSAMAFEGYKKQVQEISPELQIKLLEIAVTNLGDNPIRLFDKEVQHTPINYEKIIEKIKDMPKEKIEELIRLFQ